jgi:hypothetical protein
VTAHLISLALLIALTAATLALGAWCLWGSARESVDQYAARALDIDADPDEAAEREVLIAELEAALKRPDYVRPTTPEDHQ